MTLFVSSFAFSSYSDSSFYFLSFFVSVSGVGL